MSDAAVAALRAARAREARQNYARPPTRDPYEEFRAKLRQSAWSPSSSSLSAKKAQPQLDRSRVFFAQDIDPRSYNRVVQTIERRLPELNYAQWSALPLMVVSSWKDSFHGSGSKYPGFVVIPADFSVSGKPPSSNVTSWHP
ncbi:hypothetical protein DL89DRAFT_1482 [Linderina pennispora]|uniref:Uncharacterized protein n=1 Tax=Linderina pennispora TaxID=61395 RepID=A0A1Y1WJY4_9FUNG|nr:uncharacterized protein DL89DRAFT_1482 [Linderina pennispora]ORX73638.1 hypothetical protein DL89DRAFT_1482 [Linderina pennispora]